MTKMKHLILPVFLLFFAYCAILCYAADSSVVAYYFHGNARCVTCRNMEKYAKEAIENNFSEQLDNGTLVFKAVNIDEKDNEHFIDEYQLYTKTIIISQVKNGKEVRHKNLSKIWEYARNREKFLEYVAAEIGEYLKE